MRNCWLIGGDDSNDVTLGACFHVFFNVCLHSRLFRFALIGGNLTAQSTARKATGELEAELKFQRRKCKLSFLFPPSHQRAPESWLAGYLCHCLYEHLSHVFIRLKIHHHIFIIRLKCVAVWLTAHPVKKLVYSHVFIDCFAFVTLSGMPQRFCGLPCHTVCKYTCTEREFRFQEVQEHELAS